MYDPKDIAPWDGYGDTFEGKPYIHRQQTMSWDTEDLTWEKDLAPMAARYYGVVSQLDDAVGQILNALKKSGQWEDTIVVFTSDHGDMCGSHNMLDKHYVLYDDIIRVPLMVKVPGIKPRISTNLSTTVLIFRRLWKNGWESALQSRRTENLCLSRKRKRRGGSTSSAAPTVSSSVFIPRDASVHGSGNTSGISRMWTNSTIWKTIPGRSTI